VGLKEILRAATQIRDWGYRGSGQNYRRQSDDILFVINFQKSRWGDRFYVNLGGQPCVIPDEGERMPDAKTVKEYDCVFRHRLHGDWSIDLGEDEVGAMMMALNQARSAFEAKVQEMRELSRQGRARELLEGRWYTGPEHRASLQFARLLAADGHVAAAKSIAQRVVDEAGRAELLRKAAERFLSSLESG
jgi:hypothetical protein